MHQETVGEPISCRQPDYLEGRKERRKENIDYNQAAAGALRPECMQIQKNQQNLRGCLLF